MPLQPQGERLNPPQFELKTFEIPVRDFHRARLFYTEALCFQIWNSNCPLPAELLNFVSDSERPPPGYFIESQREGWAQLVIVCLKEWTGYGRVVFVSDVEEAGKRVVAAGGELFEVMIRVPRYPHARKQRPVMKLIKRTRFQDTEGNILELCRWQTPK